MPDPVIQTIAEKLIDKRAIVGFLAGYCISECIEKDFAVKPVLCTLTYGVATLVGAKVTYDSAALTYDTIIKPCLKAYADSKKKNGLPPLRPLP